MEHEHTTIPYTHRTSTRARHMRLAVYCDGAVVLTTPVGVGAGVVERFIEEKKRWILKKIEAFRIAGIQRIRIQHAGSYQAQNIRAHTLVLERIQHYSPLLGVQCSTVRIKNQKSCWGSCSRKGAININRNILHLPQALQDYIIVHELCHLKEFNHSKKFWAHVASLMPEHKELRKQLRNVRLSYRD